MERVTDPFDPQHYAEVRRPLLEAASLPVWCYTSERFYQREVEEIFLKTWHLVGREDEVPNPGDYLVHDICTESALVIRGDDSVVRAFANTCRHRGTRLLDDAGSCRAVICPYHGWTYDRAGRLAGMRGMEKTLEFEPSDYNLNPIRLETWAGFLFVCFCNETENLDIWLGNLPETFASYKLNDMVCTRRTHRDLKCNWKVFVENAMEDYHTPTVHRSSIGLIDCVRIDARGDWDSIFAYGERTVAVLPEDDVPFPHIEELEGLPGEGSFFTVVYPATFFGNTQDCMWWLQTMPFGPDRMRVIMGSCFPRGTVDSPSFEKDAEIYYKRWDKALFEDSGISERQQSGFASSYCVPGRFSSHEPVVHALDNWVLDRTVGPG